MAELITKVGVNFQGKAPTPNSRQLKQIKQASDITTATFTLNNYLHDKMKGLVDDYDSIFKLNGINKSIDVSYDRNPLNRELSKKLNDCLPKVDSETIPVTIMQRPVNDLELSEWIKGSLDDRSSLRDLSTKQEGFSTGFCLVNKVRDAQKLPFNATNRSQWAMEQVFQAERLGITDLYVVTPVGAGEDTLQLGGVNFHFVTTSNHYLDRIEQSIQDNKKQLVFQQKIDNTYAESYPIGKILLDKSNLKLQELLNRYQISISSESITSRDVLEQMRGAVVNLSKVCISTANADPTIQKADFNYIINNVI